MNERLTVDNALRSVIPTDEPEPYPCHRPSEAPLPPGNHRICPIARLFDFTISTHFHVISCSLFLIPLPSSIARRPTATSGRPTAVVYVELKQICIRQDRKPAVDPAQTRHTRDYELSPRHHHGKDRIGARVVQWPRLNRASSTS